MIEQELQKYEEKNEIRIKRKGEGVIRGYFRWTSSAFIFILLFPFLTLAQDNIKPFVHHIRVTGAGENWVTFLMALISLLYLIGALNLALVIGKWIEERLIKILEGRN